jgi:hypothetical protein
MNHPAAMPATLRTDMPLGVAVGAAGCGGANLNIAAPGTDPARTQGTAE